MTNHSLWKFATTHTYGEWRALLATLSLEEQVVAQEYWEEMDTAYSQYMMKAMKVRKPTDNQSCEALREEARLFIEPKD